MTKEDVCCPRLDKANWDKKEHEWKNKLFYTKHYRSFFYIPTGFGKIMKNTLPILKDKGFFKGESSMILCRNEGMWGGDCCIEVSKKEAGMPIDTLSGKFFSMYFEGNYKDVGKFYKVMKKYCEEKGYDVTEFMSYYATCPDCMKKYGTAQIILFARLT